MKYIFDKHNLSKHVAIYIILIFSVILYVFVDRLTGLNNLQIYSMYCVPFLLIFVYNKIYKAELLFYILMLVLIISALLNLKYFRLSTTLYSFMFILTYILYLRVLRFRGMNITNYMDLIKIIIYLYAIVLIIQQISVIMNIPVFNLCWSSLSNKMKLNSLSVEPSHSTLILPLLMFSYIKMKEVLNEYDYSWSKDLKKDKLIWLSFFYVMLTCGSMTTFFSLPVFLLYFFRKRFKIINVLIVILIVSLALFIISKFNNLILLRVNNLLSVLFSVNPGKIADQDASSAVRIVPYIEFFKSIDIFNIHTWFGHGIDSSERLYTQVIMGVENSDRRVGAMNITSLFYDYGLIAGSIFIIALKKATTSKFISYEMLFYFLLFSVITINHYVLWLYLILMSTNYYFERKFKMKFIPNNRL